MVNMKREQETLGNRIREERKAKGLTQSALAAKAGIAQTHLSRIERGFVPSGKGLHQIAQALGIDFYKLVRGTSEEQSVVKSGVAYSYEMPVAYCPNVDCPQSLWAWSEEDEENMYFFEYFKLPRTLAVEVGSTSPVEPGFCPHCGTALVKTCKKCGLDIQSAKHEFCMKCGAKLFPEERGIQGHISPDLRDFYFSEWRGGLKTGARYRVYRRSSLEEVLQGHHLTKGSEEAVELEKSKQAELELARAEARFYLEPKRALSDMAEKSKRLEKPIPPAEFYLTQGEVRQREKPKKPKGTR